MLTRMIYLAGYLGLAAVCLFILWLIWRRSWAAAPKTAACASPSPRRFAPRLRPSARKRPPVAPRRQLAGAGL